MGNYAQALTTSTVDRDRLIAEHMPMARRIALRVARRVPGGVGEDDLVAAAYLGLTQAADRYDTSRSEPFVAFAESRIRGAVYDELRKHDVLSRRARSRAKKVRSTMMSLQHELKREPEDEEVAAALGTSLADYQENLESLVHISVVGLGETEPAAAESPSAPESPASVLEHKQLTSRVQKGLRSLPERDGLLLSLYYNDELTYREIGEVLGVSESRVCQLHARAIARLRNRIEEPGVAA